MTRKTPRIADVFSNWRESKLPLRSKVGLLLRNNFLKLRRLDSCCGNDGQPGC